MTKSRFLILAVALALFGCGEPKNSTPQTKPEADPTPKSPAAAEATEKSPPPDTAPSKSPAPAGWTQQVKEMSFPASPPAGKVNGKPFAPQVVELSRIGGRHLTLRQGEEFNPDLQLRIALSAAKDENFSGKTYEVAPDAGLGSVSVSVAAKRPEALPPEVKNYGEKLALRLEFGQEEGGKLPGKIYLCLPDESKSYVAGTFTADVDSDYARPPRPDEGPCVSGKIALKGRDEYNLVAGFVGLTADGKPVTNLVGTTVTPQAETSVSPPAPYPPERTTLVNDAEAGCLYRHARLSPGRYLVFAGAGDRYIDWRWVEVRDKTPLTIDFTVEPDVAGTLEVVVPKDAKEGVLLVPLDEAGKVPDVKEALLDLALAMKTDLPAKDGKVVLDGLRPGNYRAMVGSAGKDVTVKAKETVRVDLSAP